MLFQEGLQDDLEPVMMQQGRGDRVGKASAIVAGKKKAKSIKVSRKGKITKISKAKGKKLALASKANKGLSGLRKNVKSQKGFDNFVKSATSRTNKRGDKKDVGMAALRRLSGLSKNDFDKKMASAIERGVVKGASGSISGASGSNKAERIFGRQQTQKRNIRNDKAALRTTTEEFNKIRA